MTDKLQEQISALVDDEIHHTELESVVDELGRNSAAAERWQRYNLISDVLRNNLPDAIEPGLARRVQQALESEPTILAPRRMRIPARMLPALKQVGGMAVAASVAVVMVVSLQQEERSAAGVPHTAAQQQMAQQESVVVPPPSATVVAEKQESPIAPSRRASLVSRSLMVAADAEQPQPVTASPQAFDPRFESYLINHSEYAVTTGILPYTRLVGHGVAGVQRASGE